MIKILKYLEGDEKLEIYILVNPTATAGGGTATLTLTFNRESIAWLHF